MSEVNPLTPQAISTLGSPVLRKAISKAVKRLMPMLIILYFIAFLDRTNVGFAEAALHTDRNVGAGAFALGAGIFFIGYAIFEIPSNLALRKVGARVWLARIAITWGIVATLFAFTSGSTMFVILRFLLGATEAGLFPGIIMFLAEWFPNKIRVEMFALFYLAQPFSQMIGAPMSGGLISFGEAITPWHGWQVMFFVQGVLAIIAGIVTLFVLINHPRDAKWLSDEEKQALDEVMQQENVVRRSDGPNGIVQAFLNWKIWYFTIIYFCLQIAVYGVTFYLPQQVSGLVGESIGWQVGLITAIPWFIGLSCYFIGRAATTIKRRRNWGTMFFVLTGLAIVGSAWAGIEKQPVLGIAFISIAVASFLACGPISWSYPTSFLTGAAAATGIGIINSLGNLGGFVAPIMRNGFNQIMPTQSGAVGVISLGAFAFLAAIMMYCTRFFRARSDALLDVSMAER